jgi:signal transduction histidine kinase
MKILQRFGHLRRWVNNSLQRKLVLWSMGFWVISVMILGLTIFLVEQSTIISETRQRNVQLASIISRDVNSQVSAILSDTRTFSLYLQEMNSSPESQAAAMLLVRLSSAQRYRAIYYFDAKGTLLIHLTDSPETLLSLKPADIINRAPIQVDEGVTNAFKGTSRNETFVSDVSFSGLENTPVMYIGMPVVFNNGESRVAVFEVALRNIWQRIDLNTIGQSGYSYAVSRNGIIIAHPQASSIGRLIPPEIAPLLKGYEGFTEYFEPSQNREVIAAYSPVGGATGWGMVIVQDRSEAYAAVIRAEVFFVGICVALAILGTIGILVMARNITRPIVNLTQTAQTIARTGDLTKTTLMHREDEVGQLSQSFDQMIERLQKSEGKLANAAAEERNRLARDLHDAVSQTLFSASLIADILPRLWDRNQTEARNRLEEVRQLTRGALAEMRTLLLELRPSSLIEAEIGHLLSQLGESVTSRSRIPVTIIVEGDCQIPVEVKVALYRISQEALNNVAKHSRAKKASLTLICQANEVTLSIQDNGRGFDVQKDSIKSLGLGIIRERAKEINAALSIHSQRDGGTEVAVSWKKAE